MKAVKTTLCLSVVLSLIIFTLRNSAVVNLQPSKQCNTTTQNELKTVPGLNGAQLPSNKKFAYAYYITGESYGCSALVAASELVRFNKDPKVDIVFIFIENSISQSMINAFKSLDNSTRTKVIKSGTELRTNFLSGYYRDCMTKIEIFNLVEYDRVIFADADGLPLHNLDHLFLLPTAEVAVPRAYWLGNPGFFTSDLAVVEPNNNTYARLVEKIKSGEDVHADMDFMNAE